MVNGQILERNESKEKLLIIALDNESSVPSVFYKGEELTGKSNVRFDWDTSDTCSPGGLTYRFEYAKEDGSVEILERRTRNHR